MRAAGHYPYQVCFGIFDPSPADFDRRRTPHQLPFAHAMITGLLEDAEGGLTTYMRCVECHSSSFTMVFDRRPAEDFGVFHPAMRQLFRGSGAWTSDEGGARFASMNEDGLPGVSFEVGPEDLRLEEPGHAQLAGPRLSAGFNLLAPQANDDIYRSIIPYAVEGELFGRSVKGFLTWNMVHAMSGEHWGYARIVPKVIYAWAIGVNRYADGTVEVIHVSAGRNGWGFLTVLEGDRVVSESRKVECDLEVDDEGYPGRVLFQTDVGDWLWTGHPKNRFAPARGIEVPYTYGVGELRRVGETRALLQGSLTGLQANPRTWRARRPLAERT